MSKLKVLLESAQVEKDVENGWRAELLKEIQNSNIESPFGGDGLLEAKNPKTKRDLRTLLEFKYKEVLKNKLTQCNVLIQCLYYIKKYELAGQKLPTTIFVGDINECFAIHTNAIVKYLSHNIDWRIPPSEAYKRNPELIQAMVGDVDILPFVYDIDHNFNIHNVIEKLWDLTDNVIRKIRITKENIVNIYDYFETNVLKDSKLTTNEKANLFIQIVTNPTENYLHPKKNTVVVTKSYGELQVNRNQFKSFFSHFEGDIYSPEEKEGLTALVDRLIEEETRRKKGEFFTPTAFVDLAHEYISKTFGADWKERFVVWDCAWGTGNLTRDYKFKELYASTIEQSDIDTANQMGYNPEARIFYYDFLNDDYSLLPQGLRDAIEGGKEILFLINPPYATDANYVGGGKGTITNTRINKDMVNEGWGNSAQNLYTQFLYRISKIQEISKNVNIGLFAPSLFLTGTSFKEFRRKFKKLFGFENGFLFEARHFSDVAKNWGINFLCFSNDPNQNSVILDAIDYDENFQLSILQQKELYNIDDGKTASVWAREETKNIKTFETISFKNSLEIYDGWDLRGKCVENSIGYLFVGGNNINTNPTNVSIYSNPFYNASGINIIKENFNKCSALFTARKIIDKNWINSKDEYLAPNESHPQYEQFTYDSLIVSLFHIHAYQTSLRQVDYKNKKWDIKNEFFWLSKEAMKNLANDNSYDALYHDARTSDERFVYNKLFIEGIYDKLSPDAKEVLDMATELLKKSIIQRKLLSESHPEYHLDSWDCGYAQLKLVWKEYFKADFEKFRVAYKKLEDRMRPLVYELGFLKS